MRNRRKINKKEHLGTKNMRSKIKFQYMNLKYKIKGNRKLKKYKYGQ